MEYHAEVCMVHPYLGKLWEPGELFLQYNRTMDPG